MPDLSSWFNSWEETGKTCTVDGVATLDCLKVVFLNLVSALILFVGLTAVIMFIVGGYKLINSAGDPKRIESAKHNFTYGLLGLSVVAFAFLIISIISGVTGVTCITSFGFVCN
jgi:hypothetical protein